MPAPLAAPLIIAGSSLFSQGINAGFTAANNRKSREWNEKMYAQQRADSLADWAMVNEYNSPKAQMQRLRDANLNPHLVYGNGASATTAGVPRSPSVEGWRPDAPQLELGSAAASLMGYYDIRLKEAQVDNLEAQNAVIKQDAIKRAYEAIKEGTELRMTPDADAGNMYESLKKSQLQMAEALVEKEKATTSTMLSRNEREAIQSDQSIRESVERIITMRQGRQLTTSQIRSINNDAELKRLEIELRRKWNVSGSDPIYIRALTYLLDRLGVN